MANRQSSTVLHAVEVLGEKAFSRKLHKCFFQFLAKGQEQSSCFCFHEKERRVLVHTVLCFSSRRGVTVFNFGNYSLFCPAFLTYCKHRFFSENEKTGISLSTFWFLQSRKVENTSLLKLI